MGAVSPMLYKHNNQPVLPVSTLSVKQYKTSHRTQNAYPGSTPVIMKRRYPTKGQRTPYRIHFTRSYRECQAQMHKFIMRFGTFSARGTKNLPGIRREGFSHFLRFRSNRYPPTQTAARTGKIHSFDPEDVTKMAVGPSAPPMMPILRAFAIAAIGYHLRFFLSYTIGQDLSKLSRPRS